MERALRKDAELEQVTRVPFPFVLKADTAATLATMMDTLAERGCELVRTAPPSATAAALPLTMAHDSQRQAGWGR